MTTLSTPLVRQHPHLRPFNARKDLLSVANLIEICFASTLDADGRRYVRQLKHMARNTAALQMAIGSHKRSPVPAAGFVWEERGEIVGNISLIPFTWHSKRFYLIANVAVNPAYRRRGIGRQLTQAGVEYALSHSNAAPWLQVRADNPTAIRLYQSLGFVEKYRRNTWLSTHQQSEATLLAGMRVTTRQRGDWALQKRWFDSLYPDDILWQFDFTAQAQAPGISGWWHRLLKGIFLRQWSIRFRGQLTGVLSWQSQGGAHTRLWLSIHPTYEQLTLPAMLWYARQRLKRYHLTFNYPAGRQEALILNQGFVLQHTLVWMRWQNIAKA